MVTVRGTRRFSTPSRSWPPHLFQFLLGENFQQGQRKLIKRKYRLRFILANNSSDDFSGQYAQDLRRVLHGCLTLTALGWVQTSRTGSGLGPKEKSILKEENPGFRREGAPASHTAQPISGIDGRDLEDGLLRRWRGLDRDSPTGLRQSAIPLDWRTTTTRSE
jgi:hypothetical protein